MLPLALRDELAHELRVEIIDREWPPQTFPDPLEHHITPVTLGV
jgi:hypothetical protein